MCILAAILQLAPSIWLTEWLSGDLEEQQKSFYPIVFSSIIGVYMLVTFLRTLTIFKIMLKSASNMHNAMTKRVLHADILFFDSNPIGRIVTRFSRDLTIFDQVMPILWLITIQGIFRTFTVVIAVSIINPWILIVVIGIGIVMWLIVAKGTRVMIES